MLTHIKKIVQKSNRFAIGAFNTYNLETTRAIVRAAVEMKKPAIIQVSENAIKYAGLESIFEIVQTVVKQEAKGVPLALHLDHGKNFDLIKKAIKIGFKSIMFDGSDLSFEENIKQTKKIVDYAHKHGVWVQGEIGGILKGRTGIISSARRERLMTDPKQAQEFVKQTKVDTLAVAVGNVHGAYKLFFKVPRLNIKLLEEINRVVKVPLVLHGGSGVNKKDITAAIRNGIRIININSDLRVAFTNAIRKKLRDDPREVDPRHILKPAINAVQKVVKQKIKLFTR